MQFVKTLRRVLTHASASVDLDVVEQWIVLTLLRFGDCAFPRLQAEVEAIRGTKPAETVVALINLEQEHLLTRLNPPLEGRQASTYRLTPLGRRVGQRIPHPPSSPVTIYI